MLPGAQFPFYPLPRALGGNRPRLAWVGSQQCPRGSGRSSPAETTSVRGSGRATTLLPQVPSGALGPRERQALRWRNTCRRVSAHSTTDKNFADFPWSRASSPLGTFWVAGSIAIRSVVWEDRDVRLWGGSWLRPPQEPPHLPTPAGSGRGPCSHPAKKHWHTSQERPPRGTPKSQAAPACTCPTLLSSSARSLLSLCVLSRLCFESPHKRSQQNNCVSPS